jgi:syntaxin-binding protein 1
VHIELAGRINAALDERDLVDLGKLEQDLVFGDATSKEVINFLSNHAAVPATDKARMQALYL